MKGVLLCVSIVVVGIAGEEEIFSLSGSSTDGDIFGDVSPAKVAFSKPPSGAFRALSSPGRDVMWTSISCSDTLLIVFVENILASSSSLSSPSTSCESTDFGPKSCSVSSWSKRPSPVRAQPWPISSMVSRGGCASLVEVSDDGVSWKCDNYVRDGGG